MDPLNAPPQPPVGEWNDEGDLSGRLQPRTSLGVLPPSLQPRASPEGPRDQGVLSTSEVDAPGAGLGGENSVPPFRVPRARFRGRRGRGGPAKGVTLRARTGARRPNRVGPQEGG